jgi:glycosyltransferase involved in cell wall biosynthesis
MSDQLRVLYSFPHRLGLSRICTIAWYEIDSAARAGVEFHVLAGDSVRPFASHVKVGKTLSWGGWRIPYRVLGSRRMCDLHDRIVALRLRKFVGRIDLVHAWPLAALHTSKVAHSMGIPVALERCNAHTRYAFDVVQRECTRINVPLRKGYEHAFNAAVLKREEQEYALADGLLCPSEFVLKTFVDLGFARERLFRFIYGVDQTVFYPSPAPRDPSKPFTVLFAGVAAVRKGLHIALEAWHQSKACQTGRFRVAGSFIPEYRQRLLPLLAHPSVEVLGHRNDIPDLMRAADVFVLPSIEEGFGLVCTEAMASGCVPLVSSACTDLCKHGENALVHEVGDVQTLREHMDMLFSNADLYNRLRRCGVLAVPQINWTAAGQSLASAYRSIIEAKRPSQNPLRGASPL